MHLVYMDDSGNDGKSKFSIATSIILADKDFMFAEGFFGWLIERNVPEELRESFEFHAKDLFHCTGAFANLGRDQALILIGSGLNAIDGMKIPVVYGAVDSGKLRAGIHATAVPSDVAFRLCIPEVERWFVEKAPKDFGVLICDDTANANQKRQFEAAFRAVRRKIKTKMEKGEDGEMRLVEESRGKCAHLHDDMYFGNSANSIGIQLADLCCFIIHRHLEGLEDTEILYKKIEPFIFAANVEPK